MAVNFHLDDWTDLNTMGPDSNEIGSFGTASLGVMTENDLGKDDLIDYMSIELESAASLSFNIETVNAAKFTIYQLQSKNGKNNVVTYSLKSLQSSTVKANASLSTKNLLLGAGTYYLCMAGTDKKAEIANYTITVNDKSVFYTQGDNSDDWGDMKSMGAEGAVAKIEAPVIAAGVLIEDGWVGYGDAIDYTEITLASATKLSLDVSATDAAKITIYQLQSKTTKGVTTYSLKSLQGTALKKGTQVSTKGLLLEAGTYYIAMESTNAKSGGSASYTVAVNDNSVFYTEGDALDNWGDMKSLGAEGAVAKIEAPVIAAGVLIEDGWVGYGDAIDYTEITLASATKLSLDVSATDAAKITIYQLQSKTTKDVTTYSLKSLQGTAVKKDTQVSTKGLLLEAGTYYLAMESTNAKSGGSASYTVAVNDNSVFYTEGDALDNWGDMKSLGAEGAVAKIEAPVIAAGVLIEDGWVGYGDAIDYTEITLASATKLSLDVSATDAAKITIYQLQSKTAKDVTTYSLKSLQGTALKKDTQVSTKGLLLEAGTYYLAMESTNAKSGGGANYTVAVNDSSVFYTEGDAYDNWGDMKSMGADGAVAKIEAPVIAAGALIEDGWVGYGDAIDYIEFTLETAASLVFDVSATDAAKFTVYQLQSKTSKDVTTYSLKSLQNTTLKAGVPTATKSLLLTEGKYYLAMESTNAKSGGSASYTVAVNDANSIFFPKGDNTNDTWKAVSDGAAVALNEQIEGWVGFGDTADFYKFEVAEAGQISLVLDDDTRNALSAKEIKLACLDANGKNIALSAIDGDAVNSSKSLAEGVYYLGISCANPQKYNTSYGLSVGMLA